jgi:hypothetical protein
MIRTGLAVLLTSTYIGFRWLNTKFDLLSKSDKALLRHTLVYPAILLGVKNPKASIIIVAGMELATKVEIQPEIVMSI